jgi:hypothetical protein
MNDNTWRIPFTAVSVGIVVLSGFAVGVVFALAVYVLIGVALLVLCAATDFPVTPRIACAVVCCWLVVIWSDRLDRWARR